MNRKIQQAIEDIKSRELPDGGFSILTEGSPAPEATAWAVIALKSSAAHLDSAGRACDWLTSIQHPDGRVTAVEGCDGTVWPTPICIIAWKCLERYREPMNAGIQFLLDSKGQHYVKKSGSPVGHDTSIVGWPWIENTHSWIEPTCLSIIALKSCGYKDHPRIREAVRMILDRQLPSGGWNYGNTTVFGKELLPNAENTGQALSALSGMTGEDAIIGSLRYLDASIRKVRTPMALAWMLHGLALWSKLPGNWDKWVIESLELQHRYGPYDTVLLSQLVSVYLTEGKMNEILV